MNKIESHQICPIICYTNENNVVLKSCEHKLCSDRYKKLLSDKCPYCRLIIPGGDVSDQKPKSLVEYMLFFFLLNHVL
jgi:hypothetical protein